MQRARARATLENRAQPRPEFRSWLLRRFAKGRLSAKDVCLAANAVAGCGLQVEDLTCHQLDGGGNYQFTVDRALGLQAWAAKHVYWLQVPKHCARTNARDFYSHPVLLLHERIADIVRLDPAAFAPPAQDRAQLQELPRFRECRLLQEVGWDSCALIGLYTDAAPWSKHESFIAVYWNGVFQRTRQLFTIIRKKDMCKCCNGRCTMEALLGCLSWSVRCLREGRFPSERHDGGRLTGHRASLRGALPIRGDIIEYRADWMEIRDSLGLRSWAYNAAPCFMCTCTAATMHLGYNIEENEQPYRTISMADYWDSLRACQVVVSVPDAANATLVEAFLDQYRRVDAAVVVAGVGLRCGDKLEVVQSGGRTVDIHTDLSTIVCPIRLVFFRGLPVRRANHSTTWFDLFTIEMICLDILHILDLGVCQYAVGLAFVLLLLGDVYDLHENTQDVLLRRGAQAMTARLMQWYSDRPTLTRVTRLTSGMILGSGGVGRPCLRAKGAESRALARFAFHEMQEFVEKLGTDEAQAMCRALACLTSYIDVMNDSGRVPTPEQLRCLHTHAVNHVVLFRGAGGCWT